MRKYSLFLGILLCFVGSLLAQEKYHGCPKKGNAKRDDIMALNLLKNRDRAPSASKFDDEITLEAILELPPTAEEDDEETFGDTDRWDDGSAARVTGVVVDVKPGGIETCNCKAKEADYRDTHIEIALDENAPNNERVIVEVTPRWRAKMKSKHKDWSTSALKDLIGKQVTFEGWLFFDSEHSDEAENTTPGRAANWRATAWEIHPVTKITVEDE